VRRCRRDREKTSVDVFDCSRGTKTRERKEVMTKTTRITTFTLGATLVGALLLGATPAVASDATEDAQAFDVERAQPRPPASASAAALRAQTHQDSLGGGGGEPSRADARNDGRAKRDRDRNDWDEYEFQQEVWTAP
jgi:hypothetical protein